MKKEIIYKILEEAYFSENMHEREVVQHLHLLLAKKILFVDIGASLGQYTYFGNKAMKKALIIAIEADKIRYDRLEENCRKWTAHSSNTIKTIYGAASDKDGDISFFTTNSNISGGLFKHTLEHIRDVSEEAVKWSEVTVKGFMLDTLLAGQKPDCIKIDVEGSEMRILNGSESLVSSGHPIFLVEIHPFKDPLTPVDYNNVYLFFKEHNYQCYNFFGRSLFAKSLLRRAPKLWLILKVNGLIERMKQYFRIKK